MNEEITPVSIRYKKDELEVIEKAMKIVSRKRSDFIRVSSIEKAKEIVKKNGNN